VISAAATTASYALSRGDRARALALHTSERVAGTPAVSGDTVYVGGNDAQLHALDLTTWARALAAKTDGWIWGKPASTTRRVYVLSNHTGAGASTRSTARPGGHSGRARRRSAASAPGARGRPRRRPGHRHAQRVRPGLRRAPLDARLGGDSFVAPGATLVTPALRGDTLITAVAGRRDASVVGLDRRDRARRFRHRGPTLGAVFGKPCGERGLVLFGADDGALHALSRMATARRRRPGDRAPA